MSTTKFGAGDTPYVIEEPVGDDGTLTVREATTGATYRVVDYADPIVAEKLAARPAGAVVRLDLTPADPDGLDWVVTRLKPGTPPSP